MLFTYTLYVLYNVVCVYALMLALDTARFAVCVLCVCVWVRACVRVRVRVRACVCV